MIFKYNVKSIRIRLIIKVDMIIKIKIIGLPLKSRSSFIDFM